MAKDYILHFQPEIPQIIVSQETSDGQMRILNVISGHETLELIDHLVGRNKYENTRRIKKA